MTPTMTQVPSFDDLVQVIRKSAKVPASVPITRETRLVEDLGIDSLDLVGLVLQIQDQFDIVIDEDRVPNLCRVSDLAADLAELGRSPAR